MPPDGRAAVAAERGRLSSSPMRDVLYPLLAVDFLQAVFALRAFQRARAGRRAGAPSYARYSFGRGLLALMGALVLAVPVVLGLASVLSAVAALVLALVLEACALPVARSALKRLEAAHQARRPAIR